MSEKRFAVTQTVLGSGIYDFQAEDTLCESYDEDAYSEVCKKLNKLNDENEQLNEKNQKLNEEMCILQIDLCKTKSYEQLEKENKRLKQKITDIVTDARDYNKLYEENKELKEKNEFAGLLANHRGEMVSFANALIQDLDDEKTQEMWENFKDEMYSKWKQKRGIE